MNFELASSTNSDRDCCRFSASEILFCEDFKGFVSGNHFIGTRYTAGVENLTWIIEAFALPSGGLSPPAMLTRTHVGLSEFSFHHSEEVHMSKFKHAATAIDKEIPVTGYMATSLSSLTFVF